MQPHFLFNALNTIKLLLKRGETQAAVQCLDMLSVLLRGMVNARHDIPLHSELKIVESYLSLQKMRFDILLSTGGARGDFPQCHAFSIGYSSTYRLNNGSYSAPASLRGLYTSALPSDCSDRTKDP